jgi:hypothetical protein
MGMKDPDPDQLVVLTDHGQDRAHILDITQVHGVVDAVLYGVQEEFGAFAGGIDELGLLVPNVEKGIDKDAAYQQGDGGNYYPGCEALEHVK